MARLINLPDTLEQLYHNFHFGPCGNAQRFGQWVWNNHGQAGIDGNGWPELFYAELGEAMKILTDYYSR